MTKHRKTDSARDRARKIQSSVPFSNLRTELNPDTQEVRLVHHGQRWPGPDEPIDEQSALLALQRGNQTEARFIVGRYLRERFRFASRPRDENKRLRLPFGQTSISVRVLANLADMIDPPQDCVLPFIFEFRPHSDEIYKLGRYAEIGRYYLSVLEKLKKEKKESAGCLSPQLLQRLRISGLAVLTFLEVYASFAAEAQKIDARRKEMLESPPSEGSAYPRIN